MYSQHFTTLARCGVITGLFCLSACTNVSSTSVSTTANTQPNHERLNSVLWMQTSAEYQALSLSAYHQATAMLDKGLTTPNWTAALEQSGDYQKLPPAIILDIDETVLDNSPFQAQLIKDNAPFTQTAWDAWTKQASAIPLPGAKAYLDYVHAKGVTIFYVTNRDASQEQDTRRNLQLQKLPLRDDIDVVLTKNENGWSSSDKGARRSFVSQHFRIIALVGDDFGDFASQAKGTPDERVAVANANASAWGTKWFLIPNPVYGSWEAALHNHDYKISPAEVTAKKLTYLRGMNTSK